MHKISKSMHVSVGIFEWCFYARLCVVRVDCMMGSIVQHAEREVVLIKIATKLIMT